MNAIHLVKELIQKYLHHLIQAIKIHEITMSYFSLFLTKKKNHFSNEKKMNI